MERIEKIRGLLWGSSNERTYSSYRVVIIREGNNLLKMVGERRNYIEFFDFFLKAYIEHCF